MISCTKADSPYNDHNMNLKSRRTLSYLKFQNETEKADSYLSFHNTKII